MGGRGVLFSHCERSASHLQRLVLSVMNPIINSFRSELHSREHSRSRWKSRSLNMGTCSYTQKSDGSDGNKFYFVFCHFWVKSKSSCSLPLRKKPGGHNIIDDCWHLIAGQMKTNFAKNSWCQCFTELAFSFSFMFLFMTWISGFLYHISKAARYRECLVTKLQKEKMQKNKTNPC